MRYIDQVTEAHANATEGIEYGNETIIELKGGCSIRCSAYPLPVDYVRVCDDDGRELMYWNEDEFKENFPDVMGAFLGLCRQTIIRSET